MIRNKKNKEVFSISTILSLLIIVAMVVVMCISKSIPHKLSALGVLIATVILLIDTGKQRRLAAEKDELQSENKEIRDIIASANMGTWRIELVENREPRMYVDDTMKRLLGIEGQERTPEQTYTDWFEKINPQAVASVLESVEKMQQGNFDENTYLWEHPLKGTRYVRCGGTAEKILGGFILSGYHYDVDEVVREDQAKVEQLHKALDEKNEYYSTLGTLEGIFYSMHVINLLDDTVEEFNSKNEVKEIVNHRDGATEMMVQVMSLTTVDEHRDAALEFTDLTTLSDRMKGKKLISQQFIGKSTGWFLASFIAMETDEMNRPTKVIYTTRIIDDIKKEEERLIKKAQTDELTGLLNRRAYEEDIYEHNDKPEQDEFIYISLDVNGLKVVNDSKGHMAGDELIIGACQCMRRILGPYGRLYRIGGDEFVAILTSNTKNITKLLSDFDKEIAGWTGSLLSSISISYGWINKDEEPGASVRQLGAIAEARMYEAKDAFYKEKGFDRRGQRDAHKALCDLYTKILKINITDDTFEVVNMDITEQTTDKGFADTISGWLSGFGKSGQVHSDDLENYLKKTDLEYLKNYFREGKTSISIFYRRKYAEGFKQVAMDMIPADDYTPDNQTLYLYVKDIDM